MKLWEHGSLNILLWFGFPLATWTSSHSLKKSCVGFLCSSATWLFLWESWFQLQAPRHSEKESNTERTHICNFAFAEFQNVKQMISVSQLNTYLQASVMFVGNKRKTQQGGTKRWQRRRRRQAPLAGNYHGATWQSEKRKVGRMHYWWLGEMTIKGDFGIGVREHLCLYLIFGTLHWTLQDCECVRGNQAEELLTLISGCQLACLSHSCLAWRLCL